MAFNEDLSGFFAQADFAVSATFTPQLGVAETASVIFDSPSDALFGGDMIFTDYNMTYRASDLPNIVAGDSGTVNGVDYTVREVRLTGDGKLKVARLTADG